MLANYTNANPLLFFTKKKKLTIKSDYNRLFKKFES